MNRALAFLTACLVFRLLMASASSLEGDVTSMESDSSTSRSDSLAPVAAEPRDVEPEPMPETRPSASPDENLLLQRRMADAAEQSAFWSKWQFIASVVAGIVLVVTLLLNAIATRAASKAAQAAVESLRLSGRGHLGVEKFTFHRATWDTDKETDVRGVHVVPTFANHGNAPVIVTRTVISTRTVRDGDIESINWEESTLSPDISIHIGPNTSVSQAPLIINLHSLDLIFRDELRVLYMFRLRYQDMFTDAEYHTDSCFELRVNADPRHLLDSPQISLSQYLSMEARGEYGSAN